MTKPREKTRKELTSEIEDGKKKIQQFDNREKMLRQKLSKEKRRISPFGTKGALLYMVCDHVSCALRGPARTSESPGRLRRYAPYKGLHPLRRFAAIPAPSLERYIRFASAPFQRG